MNKSSVLNVLGRLCLLFGLLLLLPVLVILADEGLRGLVGGFAPPDADFHVPVVTAFLMSAACSFAVGLLLVVGFRLDHEDFDSEEAFAVVTLSWFLFMAFGALPYWITGAIPHPLDACFESLSGFTTTGASILSDPAAIGRPLLFWRAMTHWVGGMGIVALSLAILPALGAGGFFLFKAEVSGPQKEKLLPRMSHVARLLWGVYLGITLLEILSLWVAGMTPFDAMCHSFATVATGGFGTRADSLASFSPAVQWVVIVFMVLAGLNFLLLLDVLRGRPGQLFRNAEVRTWLTILLVASVLCVVVLVQRDGWGSGVEDRLRGAVFTVVSICSTTGFATEDYGLWPVSLHVIVILLMVSAACSGSTSGGPKVIRHIMWAKAAARELQRLLRPTGVFVVRVSGREIDERIVSKSMSFLLFYLGAACLGALLLTLIGLGAAEAISSVVTCLSGVGPGLGAVGPTSNFGALPGVAKGLLMAYMLLGRLEFFAVLALLSPLAWRR